MLYCTHVIKPGSQDLGVLMRKDDFLLGDKNKTLTLPEKMVSTP